MNHKLDSLFFKAADVVVIHQLGSISLLQRKLNIGYNKACDIMDQLAEYNIVGGLKGLQSRDVLIQDEVSLRNHLFEKGILVD